MSTSHMWLVASVLDTAELVCVFFLSISRTSFLREWTFNDYQITVIVEPESLRKRFKVCRLSQVQWYVFVVSDVLPLCVNNSSRFLEYQISV
jgi:hypothetical protein